MKNVEMNKSAKRILVSGVLAAALFLTAQNTTFANEKNPGVATASAEDNAAAEKISVNYIGKQDGSFMFHVNLNNAANSASVLTITDEGGEVLYSAKVDAKGYNKTFAVPQDLGLQKINFTVRTNVSTTDGSVTTDRVKTFTMSSLFEK
jgi:hypothetical protein